MGNASTEGGGITGTRSLGVRELTYKMAFLASSVQVKPSHNHQFPIILTCTLLPSENP